MAAALLKVRVVSPETTVFEGEALAFVAPAWDGKVGVLPGHAPYITLLGGGHLDIDLPGGGSERFFLNRGVMKVEGDEAVLLTEYAGREAPADFDGSGAWLESTDFEDTGHPAAPSA